MLAKRGPQALTIRCVARELGVTTGSFYHHFDSADAYFRDLLRYWHAEILFVRLLDTVD